MRRPAEAEVLHQHGAHGEDPVAVGVDGDAAAVGEGHEALLVGPVGPEGRVGRVGDEPRGREQRVGRADAARRADRRGDGVGRRRGPRVDAEDAPVAVAHHVDLAVGVLAEGADVEPRRRELLPRRRAHWRRRPRPHAPRHEVAEEERPHQPRHARPAVDVAPGDRHAERAVVLRHGEDQARPVARRGVVAAGALHDVPPVVAAAADDVDLLEGPLPHVAGPEGAGRPVEAPAPRVAEPPGVDLRRPAARREGVVRGDAVARALSARSTSMRSNFPEQRVEVLPVRASGSSRPNHHRRCPRYSIPSGPKAMPPPLWLAKGCGTSRMIRSEAGSMVRLSLRVKRAMREMSAAPPVPAAV